MSSRRRRNDEELLQRAVAELLDLLANAGQFWWAHVPNGGARTKAEAGILKAMGVKAGVADILIISHPAGCAYWIELKAGAGVLSDLQANFGETMAGYYGAPYAVCRSIDEVRAVLKEWRLAR